MKHDGTSKVGKTIFFVFILFSLLTSAFQPCDATLITDKNARVKAPASLPAVMNLTNSPKADLYPAWSPDGSKIAFESYRDGNYEVYVMNSNGSGVVNLSNNKEYDGTPAWSPDGKKIAFRSYRDGNYEVYVVNADGSGLKNITNSIKDDYNAAWSPDGKKIAFQSYREGNYEVYSTNPDGSGLVRLTTSKDIDSMPNWSPDGSKIAFVSKRDGDFELYLMNADGKGPKNLSNSKAWDSTPDWTPNGRQLVFGSQRDADYEIYAVNTDGSGLVNLTQDKGYDVYPSWSPDGSKIAFVSKRDGNLEIYLMNADGSVQTNITGNAAVDQNPAWSPDGKKLAFSSERDGNAEIYVADLTAAIAPQKATPVPTLAPIPTIKPANTGCNLHAAFHDEWRTVLCWPFDTKGNWWTGTDLKMGIEAKVDDGKYIISYNPKNATGYKTGFSISPQISSALDYVVSVSGRIESKFKSAIWGILVRGSNKDGYSFRINNYGSWWLTYHGADHVSVGNLKRGSNKNIKWDAENTITVVVEGKDLTFYVNGEPILVYECDNNDRKEIAYSIWVGEGAAVEFELDNFLVKEKPA